MTWTPPAPSPQSFQWLMTADHNEVTPELFLIICKDWITWQREMGVTDQMQSPTEFFNQYSDLQNFANVVSWWPKSGVPVIMQAPTLAGMVSGLRVFPEDDPQTFAEILESRVERVKAFILSKGGNVENPNETAEERARRKNRERQQRYQLRHAKSSGDPELDALVQAAKAEADKLTEWKAYLRKYVKEQKLACDSAIRAAKQLRDDNISDAERAISEQEARMRKAKEALDNYRINK